MELKEQLVPVAETVFVIPAEAGIQFFVLDPCFGFPQGGVPRRGDIVGFCFPQQELISDVDHFNSLVEIVLKQLFSAGPGCGDGEKTGFILAIASVFAFFFG